MPSRVIVSASSMQLTPSQSALSAATGTTVSNPWPYAFALITAMIEVPGPAALRNASMLLRSRDASISIQDNMGMIIGEGRYWPAEDAFFGRDQSCDFQ